ncbi:MAG: uracil phosphoribosyltransferase [Aequorivita sp.]
MTWRDFWEGIASLFEDTLLVPFQTLYNLELESWLLANIVSWILLLTGAIAFTYWMLQLRKFNDNTDVTYTFDENP